MNTALPLKVTFRYEKCELPKTSPLESFAVEAQDLLSQFPLMAPHSPFAQASRVSGGAFHNLAGGGTQQSAPEDMVRLRSIETPLGTLEHSYNSDGRLSKTVYPDHDFSTYQYDGAGRLTSVTSRGQATRFQYNAMGYPRQIDYSQGKLNYDHDPDGKLTRVTFPDRVALEYRYDHAGRLSEVRRGDLYFRLGWDAQGRFEELRTETATDRFHFRAGDSTLRCDLSSRTTLEEKELTHLLGFWRLAPRGNMTEMIGCDGSRSYCAYSANNADLTTWSVRGREVHHFSNDQVVTSVAHANGTRSVFRETEDKTRALLIEHDSVSQYEYGSDGRLLKRRHSSGAYWMLRYARNGLPREVRHTGGLLRLGFDSTGFLNRLASADFVGEFSQDLAYFRIKGNLLRASPLNAFFAFCAIAWEWNAAIPSLRLSSRSRG